jgi:ParB family chromosome partitioning protein
MPMAEKADQMDPDEKIVEIAIERLRVFENHPFRVEMDSQMKDLQDSIHYYK